MALGAERVAEWAEPGVGNLEDSWVWGLEKGENGTTIPDWECMRRRQLGPRMVGRLVSSVLHRLCLRYLWGIRGKDLQSIAGDEGGDENGSREAVCWWIAHGVSPGMDQIWNSVVSGIEVAPNSAA